MASKRSAARSTPNRRPARARETQIAFEALSIEGGLLSPEWFSKVAQLQAGTQAEADYRIPKGLNLRDEIGRYWRIAQAHWTEFNLGRASNADAKGIADRFVTAVLREAFGFTSLAPTAPVTLSERSYPIGYAGLGGRVPVVIAPAESGLDARSSAFGDGGRRRSAFGLAQEYLNAQDGALWGISSDGVMLRIVRDNASLTRPAWIEADLLRIFTEERYADFAALWLLCHESRFGREDQPITECALEAWRNAGREEGTRAREHLRTGVEEALVALGEGFRAHPENQTLRAELQSGAFPVKDYFNQLLRLVYRLIFLLTVEERALLHPDDTTDAAKTLYAHGYGMRRLRERAAKRSAHDRFSDLWEATKVVCRGLATGESRLGLPALAGIFAKSQCPALDAAKLENRALLLAVFKLAWLREDGSLARVNWRDMGPEELGSVYESLLELVPQIAKDGRQFSFATGGETKGNARKTTGSYYTPDSLVQVLLDSALEPVIADTIARNASNPIDSLLGLSIVDPACGSGHFLLAAARRLGAHVARLQANGTPSAAEYRSALRQVVGRCIFGVDLNPMAVELCKVSLWMEAVEPGLPLTFLDSHIQHGNALLGTTPELMANGIPDKAWDPIEGDNKKIASALKKRNKKAADAQRSLDLWKQSKAEVEIVARAVAALDAARDASAEDLAKKEEQWDGILGSAEYRHQKLVADTWCAAFVWPKQSGKLTAAAPTNDLWWQLRAGQETPPELMTTTVFDLAEQYGFFHWHLQFSQVFSRSGFDVVLSNPPWERIKLQEKEWFAERNPEIAAAPNAAARKRMIETLKKEAPDLHNQFLKDSRTAEGESHLVRNSGRFPLCGRGDINTYAIFTETMRDAISPTGRVGCIVPSGIVTDETKKYFAQKLVATKTLASLYQFLNKGFFPGVRDAQGNRFCLLTLHGSAAPVERPDFVFSAWRVSDLAETNRHFSLTATDVALLNPNTGTLPIFQCLRDAEITKRVFRNVPVLVREGETEQNSWGVSFLRMLDMANDSDQFRTRDALEGMGAKALGNRFVRGENEWLPLYEAKMVHHFDHRFGDYALARLTEKEVRQLPQATVDRLFDPSYAVSPRYWVAKAAVEARLNEHWSKGWLLGWRDICSSVDVRTVIASVLPRVAVNDKFLLMMPNADASLVAVLYSNLCSYAFDYCARQKVGGTSLKYFAMKQLPVLPPATYSREAPWAHGVSVQSWLLQRVLELTYTTWDLEAFAHDVGYHGPPFGWDPERRFLLRCELDAAFFHLYGLAREDTDYVMDTFPIVRKDDEKTHSEYRTKRLVLEIYDAMAEAARTSKPYRTPLDPLPGTPAASHGTFSPGGTPRDYAEALRIGLLWTLIRSADGISLGMLARALLWLQDSKHAASWLEGSAFTEFEQILDSVPLLVKGAAESRATELLAALETAKAITQDAKGIVRLHTGASIPNWLPQTPTLAKLASTMRDALERSEHGSSAPRANETLPIEKAKRA